MNDYWIDRIRETNEALYDKTADACGNQLKRYYNNAAKKLKKDILVLLNDIEAETASGEVKLNDLYRSNRYYVMLNNINKNLVALGAQEIKLDEKYIKKIYELTEGVIENNAPFTTFALPTGVDSVLNTVWCADKKIWSERVWANQTLLQDKLQTALVDCIARGMPRDKVVGEMMKQFGVGYNNANRIIRTELNHAQTQAAADRYQSAGITSYKFLAAKDERTSDICRELNGKVFNFIDAAVGENMPPCHPNCRSTIVPVIK